MTWLVAATWKGSLLLAIALAVHVLLRDRIPARWRHALLLVAMLRLLLPVAPAAPFSIFNLTSAVSEPSELRVTPREFPLVVAGERVEQAPAPADKEFPAIPALLTLWGVGAAAVVARVVYHSMRLRRRLREELPASPLSSESLDLLNACRDSLGIRRRVGLMRSNVVATPSLHGLLKPALLLPSTIADTFSMDQLRFIFLHELAHLRRWDVFLNWITVVIQALHWFNPLVWIAVTRLNEDRELACDALALASLDRRERGAYGETVLQILDRFRAPLLAPGLIGMSATKEQMKRRIQMIAKFRSESRRAGWLGAVVAMIALVTLTDASAGEKKTFIRQAKPLTAEARAVMDRLDQTVTFELSAKSIDEFVNAISNRTGVRLTFAPDAIDAQARLADIKLKAKDVPAHIVLIETLAPFELGLDFNADGASIVKMPAHMRFEIPAGGIVEEDRVIIVGPNDGSRTLETERFRAGEETPAPGRRMMLKKIDVDSDVKNDKNGEIHCQIKLRGGAEGQPEGTLELEVHRAPVSNAR